MPSNSTPHPDARSAVPTQTLVGARRWARTLERKMIVLLVLLVLVPIAAWLYARRFMPQFSATATGVGFGLVVSPLSMGLYATYFLGPLGIVTGMIGLVSGMFHTAPGFHIIRSLGLVPPGVIE